MVVTLSVGLNVTTKNIQLFDEYAGQIFAHLYQSFPVPTSVMPQDFISCGSIGLQNNEFAHTGEDAKIFLATAKWLVMSGYITCNGENFSYVRDAVLTAKGLEILKSTPSSIKGGPSLGDRLATAAKEDGREALRSVTAEVLGLGVRLISPLVGLAS